MWLVSSYAHVFVLLFVLPYRSVLSLTMQIGSNSTRHVTCLLQHVCVVTWRKKWNLGLLRF